MILTRSREIVSLNIEANAADRQLPQPVEVVYEFAQCPKDPACLWMLVTTRGRIVSMRNVTIYNISSCMDCMMDEEVHPELTLAGKGGCASWERLPIYANAEGELRVFEGQRHSLRLS